MPIRRQHKIGSEKIKLVRALSNKNKYQLDNCNIQMLKKGGRHNHIGKPTIHGIQ